MRMSKTRILDSFIGTAQEVLFETFDDGRLEGRAKNYLPVVVEGPADKVKTICRVECLSREGERLMGRLID